MWCEVCYLGAVCKYREEVEQILAQNKKPYYIRNNKNEVTPVRQIFCCDCFDFRGKPS